MQLSPLQSRLAASVIASCLLVVLYLFLFAPQFALAADLPIAHIPSGPDLDASFYDVEAEERVDSLDAQGASYEPDFSFFDRSIIGRVPDGVAPLDVDQATRSNIDPGSTVAYVFEVASISGRSAQEPNMSHELRRSLNGTQEVAEGEDDDEPRLDTGLVRRQQSSKTLYISANTCNQPGRISPDQTTMDPPQLTLFVSTSSENTAPGPGKEQGTQKAIVFDEGAVMFNTSLDRDVYFSISAPEVSKEYFSTTLPYNFEVAVSLKGYHHAYDDKAQPNLYWVDSDASSTLLTTRNLTSDPKEVISTPPYTVFVQNTNNLDINGIRNSYCGLDSWAQIRPLHDGNSQATMGLRQGGAANLTMQEFYINGLNASTNYTGIVALNTSLTLQKRQDGGSGGGVIVYNGVSFSTKPNGACTFIFNLTVCTETRYAVPGNSATFPNGTALAAFYENYTRTMWDNFDKVLQQTPCQAPPTQKYSLAKGCDDCKQAYKNWLCSVAIPRCEDFSSPNETYLQMRNINAPFPDGSLVDQDIRKNFGQSKAFNSSRNVEIDNKVQPGPYKEVLPCDYLCYELVQSCPASMGFSCPQQKSKFGFNTSYAVLDKTKQLSCNYPGSAHYPSTAGAITVSWAGMVTLAIMALLLAS
ncbi:stretch-activated Ca2+-permeable channel component-domain-containing protein [Xylariaceae sp. AK1471]|nr:stretch-activated Ca2+-permeable channel component-domain-containing protein [Xylariaceae sp. AK1471]